MPDELCHFFALSSHACPSFNSHFHTNVLPPHVIEPQYPGAFESLITLNDCWDEEALQKDRESIISLWRQNVRCHERCCRFLAAACSLLNDSYRIAAEFVDAGKIARYAARVARKEFGAQKSERGRESIRFLSAVTAQGVTVFTDTPQAMCNRIYLIEDDSGAVSRLLMNAIRSHALEAGLDIISCYCVTSPFEKLEHVLILDLGVGFLTSNRYHPFEIECYRRIHAKRFQDMAALGAKRQRLSFNRKAVTELLGEASRLIAEAKVFHDELETHYTLHMDFDKVNEKTGGVISSFLRLCGSNE